MFPDYPEIKRRLNKEFLALIKSETKKDPLLSMIHYTQVYEGNTFAYTTDEGSLETGQYKEISTKFEIPHEEILLKGPDAYFSKVPQIAKEWIGKQSKLMFQKINEVTDKTGNVVHNSRPFSPESILAAMDKIAIAFDEFGNPLMPALIIHPNNTEGLKEEFQVAELDKLFILKYKLSYRIIIDKKRQEWIDRDRHRKLVE